LFPSNNQIIKKSSLLFLLFSIKVIVLIRYLDKRIKWYFRMFTEKRLHSENLVMN